MSKSHQVPHGTCKADFSNEVYILVNAVLLFSASLHEETIYLYTIYYKTSFKKSSHGSVTGVIRALTKYNMQFICFELNEPKRIFIDRLRSLALLLN